MDHMKGQALLALQGPKAVEVLEAIAPGVSELGFMQGGPFRVVGHQAWISRSGYTGEDGFEISCEPGDAADIAERLLGEAEVAPIGLGARDSLRLEAGLCLYGHDIDEATNPIEAGLVWTIGKRRREEGSFPGADAILSALRDGPRRKRVGIRPDGRAPAREGTALVDEAGKAIGTITSGGFGPSVVSESGKGGPVAMGYVDAAQAAEGTRLSAVVRDVPRPARIAKLPFVATRYYRG
jgi:aminomethyltransferase